MPPAATSPEPSPSGSHHRPAFAAVGTILLALFAAHGLVGCLLPAHLADFASHESPVRLTGNQLQTLAFQTPGELPIYGSSELDHHSPNRPDIFFRNRPTGFSVFPVGRAGTSSLVLLQKLAAAGRVARGKKIVVFLSASWFAKEEMAKNAALVNLAAPQLGEWIFSSPLRRGLKGRIARRMEAYPDTLKDQGLLTEATHLLADPTPGGRLLFASLVPLGKLQNALFASLEDVVLLDEMVHYEQPPHAPRHPHSGKHGIDPQPLTPTEPLATGEPDWDFLAREAEAKDAARNDGNRYSATTRFATKTPTGDKIRMAAPGSKDQEFHERLPYSMEWTDLVLLMDVMKALKVKGMFLSQPFNGVYTDFGGVDARARHAYYRRLARMVASYGIPIADFSEHEDDRMFFNDSNHPSGKGWVYYDRAIDHFYRGIKD